MPEAIGLYPIKTREALALSASAIAEDIKAAKNQTQKPAKAKKGIKGINNYLKTPEELESELIFTAFIETNTSNGLPMMTTDGYFNTHGSVDVSGTMEENY